MASKIIDGVVYDEAFAQEVGSVYERVKSGGNCANGRTTGITTRLMKRLAYRNPNANVLEHYRKGEWSFSLVDNQTVATKSYFLVRTVGYGDENASIEAVCREAAFKWACDNMSVEDTIREFPDLVTDGVSYAAEVTRAEEETKARERAETVDRACREERIAKLERELEELRNDGVDSQP